MFSLGVILNSSCKRNGYSLYIEALTLVLAANIIPSSKPAMPMYNTSHQHDLHQEKNTILLNLKAGIQPLYKAGSVKGHEDGLDSYLEERGEISRKDVKKKKTIFHKLPETEKRRLHRKKIRDERNKILKDFEANPYEFKPTKGEARRSLQGKLRNVKPNLDPKYLMHPKDVNDALKHRRTWGSSGGDFDVYEINLADPGATYDEWQQAYRTLGAFVDCDHSQGSNSGSGDQDGNGGCSRWMMWAAYIDPNYQGGGYYEYHWEYDDVDKQAQDEEGGPAGSLDCHKDDTNWLLLGVYRQEFYQYLEQISKHLWAEDEFEYITALSTLEYIGEDECQGVGYSNNGETIYASIQPLSKGYFQMGLYLDEDCLYPQDQDTLGYTYDDFYEAEDRRRLDEDDDNGWWAAAQEYTLANANLVYDDFKTCTLCIDYPTYQDGEINGDSGYDDDDLINQCWKFYSHDSYNCGAECIRNANRQGSLTNLVYGSNYFGTRFIDDDGQSTTTRRSPGTQVGRFSFSQDKFDRLKANIYVTFAGILFIATFLAFSVARSNRNAVKRGLSAKAGRPRSRRKSRGRGGDKLLDQPSDDDRRRSKSRTKKEGRSRERSQSRSRYEAPEVSPRGTGRKSRPRRKGNRSRDRDRDGGRLHRSSSRGGNSVSSRNSRKYRSDDF